MFQHMTGDQARAAQERFDADVAYAEKAEEHLWIVAVAHRITAEKALRVTAGEEDAILDAESVGYTGIGCFRCERAFDRRLVGKRCRETKP